MNAMPSASIASSFDDGLAAYRDRVSSMIASILPDREPKRHLYALIAEQLAHRGKCIRPALCLATCGAFGGDEERALPAAASLELLHNAFLVHDDIEDGSQYRRGQPTLHVRHGVPLAINVGDAMNALSVQILRRNQRQLGPELALRIFDEFDHMSLETIEGQALELGWIRDNDCSTTADDYLWMVLKKTGWYSFIHPMRIGALIAAPERDDLDRFHRFGYFLGTAFQIQDDVLNLTGDHRRYGKEVGGDLLEGKRTLILSHLFANGDAHEKERLRAFLARPRAQRAPRDVAWLEALLRSRGSLDYARKVAREFAESARREFNVAYAGAESGPQLDFISALVDFMLSRQA
jgi:geranylgeranyl pyrophosphate synthase